MSKVRTFRGRDGYGFHAVLNRDGAAVADVRDHASGGPVDFHWRDVAAHRVAFTTFDHDDSLVQRTGTPEEALFVAHCNARGTYESYGLTLRYTPDVVADEMAFDVDNRRRVALRLKRTYKKHVVFVNNGQECFCRSSRPDVDPMTLVPGVKERHPNAIILNTMPIEQAVEICMELARASASGAGD
ncbi:hypothetical protein [Paraburkholderia jirisanensis]